MVTSILHVVSHMNTYARLYIFTMAVANVHFIARGGGRQNMTVGATECIY